MNFICVIVFTAWLVSSESLSHRSLKRIPVVDDLIQRLEGERWPDAACRGDTLRILYGVRNDTLWATWIWDSMQLPVGVFYGTGAHLGNFDQCINTPRSDVSTQYCLVDARVASKDTKLTSDSADEYLTTLSPSGRSFFTLGFGACMPAVCSPSSISKFYRHLLQLTHLPDANLISIDPTECQTSVPKLYPTKMIIYLSVFGALLIIVTISTVYTQYYDTNENSTVDGIAKSFSLSRNWNDLFKVNKNEIKVLSGMRVITSMLVIGCHQFLFSMFLPSMMTNSVEMDKLHDDEKGQALTHLDLIVDTFFAISGLLLIKGLLEGRQKNLLVVLIKRYFRLIGPYAVMTFYILCLARHTGSGPIWLRSNANEESVCEKHWWKNFFMLNYDLKTMCIAVAWYVSCDYHLTVLTVLLFWIYRRHRRAGVAAFIAVIVGLTAQLAVKAYNKELPFAIFSNFKEVAEIRDYAMMNELYIRWHDRAGSYFVGIAMGALMTIYKPAEHRHIISKKTSFAIVVISIIVMIKVASISFWFSGGQVAAAIALATHRMVWAIAVCCIIAASEYGNTGIISDFLGCSLFVPLGKLTYGIYMIHFFIVQRCFHSGRANYHFDLFNMALLTLGTAVLAGTAALVLYLLVEAPCINLSNVYFSEKNEKSKLNGSIKSNGVLQNGTNGVHNGANGISKQKAS